MYHSLENRFGVTRHVHQVTSAAGLAGGVTVVGRGGVGFPMTFICFCIRSICKRCFSTISLRASTALGNTTIYIDLGHEERDGFKLNQE